jgi:hypothetical protein
VSPESPIFDRPDLDGLDEPVRRYFGFSLGQGVRPADSFRLKMKGRIRVGIWMPFAAEQWLDGLDFEWVARVPARGLPVLEVTDRYRSGSGGTSGRMFGRFRAFSDESPDAVRSAAMRAVMEGTLAPPTLLPGRGVEWRAESEESIAFCRPDATEASEVRLRIDGDGRPIEVSAMRWHTGDGEPGYRRFGCIFDSVGEFGSMTVPNRITAGWGFGSERFRPFFKAAITALDPA